MSQKRILSIFLIMLLGVVTVMLIGCKTYDQQMQQRIAALSVDHGLSQAVHDNLNALGGLDTWLKIDKIQAKALATMENPDSGQTLLEQHYCLNYGESLGLMIESKEPGELSREVLNPDATVAVWADGDKVALDPAAYMGTAVKLRLIAQAMTGAAGFLNNGYHLEYIGLQRQAGKMMHQIELTGVLIKLPQAENEPNNKHEQVVPAMDRMVFWLDADKKQVERIWLSYCLDRQSGDKRGYLAANVREYKALSNGMMVPTLLEIVPGDAFQQFSERKIMTIQFLDIDVIEKKR